MGGSRWAKNSFLYLLLLVVLIIAAVTLFSGGSDTEDIPFVGGRESFLERLRNDTGPIELVEVDGDQSHARIRQRR